MKRALITGGTGFVGANLARRLLRDGHEVHLLVRPDYHSWRIDSIKPDLRLHTASITDADSVTRAVRAARPNWVFHLAAYGAYPTQQDQQRMHDTNVLGTTTLLDACGHVTVEAFIHAGSSSEYGRRTKPHRETDDPHPESDYAKTKLAATRACQERAQQTGAEILSNVVDGAGQAARCSISSPSLNFFPSKTWTISSEPLSLRQRTSA